MLRHGLGWRSGLRDLSVLGLFSAAGMSFFLLYNLVTFGDALKTGYHYWLTSDIVQREFGFEHLIPNLVTVWRDLIQSEIRLATAGIYGAGSYFGPAFAILFLISLRGLLQRKGIWIFALAGLISIAPLGMYRHFEVRLMFPFLIVMAPSISVGLTALWQRSIAQSRALKIAVVLLFTAAVLGWPGRDHRPELFEFFAPSRHTQARPAYQVMADLTAMIDKRAQLVLTDMPPPYVHALLPTNLIVAPLVDRHRYRFNPLSFRYDHRSRDRLIRRAVRRRGSVWLVSSKLNIRRIREVCPPPDGFRWRVRSSKEGGGTVARLRRRRGRLSSNKAGKLHTLDHAGNSFGP